VVGWRLRPLICKHPNTQDTANPRDTSSLMAWGSSDLFLAQDMSVLEKKSTTTDPAARKMWRPMSAILQRRPGAAASARPVRVA
jgi:hypothetical protein